MKNLILSLLLVHSIIVMGNTNNAMNANNVAVNPALLAHYTENLTSVFLSECADSVIAKNKISEAIEKGIGLLQSTNTNLQVFGDIILTKTVSIIETGFNAGNYNSEEPLTKKMLKILAKNQYFIRIDMSDSRKIWLNVKEGNFRYLFSRIVNRLHPFFLWSIAGLSFLVIISLSLRYIKNNELFNLKLVNMKKFASLLFCVTVFVTVLKGQTLSESYYKSVWNNEVVVNTLISNGNTIMGQSIYLPRTSKKVKAKYFAFSNDKESVYQRYYNWKKTGKKVITCCAGAYTSGNYSTPLGLTIDGGQIVNRNIDSKLDGLCIVEEIGGIRIADLEQPNCILLQSINQYINPRYPLQKQQFISWAANEKATVFQTNLLYFKNIAKMGSVPAAAERRLLALVEKNGAITNVIFNIERSVSLTDIATGLFDLLRSKGYNVIAMVNLDTGRCNVFEIYDTTGRQLPFHGNADITKLSNMIVYYYD